MIQIHRSSSFTLKAAFSALSSKNNTLTRNVTEQRDIVTLNTPADQHSSGFQTGEKLETILVEWHRFEYRAPEAWRERVSQITRLHEWLPVKKDWRLVSANLQGLEVHLLISNKTK